MPSSSLLISSSFLIISSNKDELEESDSYDLDKLFDENSDDSMENHDDKSSNNSMENCDNENSNDSMEDCDNNKNVNDTEQNTDWLESSDSYDIYRLFDEDINNLSSNDTNIYDDTNYENDIEVDPVDSNIDQEGLDILNQQLKEMGNCDHEYAFLSNNPDNPLEPAIDCSVCSAEAINFYVSVAIMCVRCTFVSCSECVDGYEDVLNTLQVKLHWEETNLPRVPEWTLDQEYLGDIDHPQNEPINPEWNAYDPPLPEWNIDQYLEDIDHSQNNEPGSSDSTDENRPRLRNSSRRKSSVTSCNSDHNNNP